MKHYFFFVVTPQCVRFYWHDDADQPNFGDGSNPRRGRPCNEVIDEILAGYALNRKQVWMQVRRES